MKIKHGDTFLFIAMLIHIYLMLYFAYKVAFLDDHDSGVWLILNTIFAATSSIKLNR